jgi:hypothetical protein
MYIFATGKIVKPSEIGPHIEDEKRATDVLRDAGVILQAFRFADHPGVVSFLEADSVADARLRMSELPFVALGLMEFEYSEVTGL